MLRDFFQAETALSRSQSPAQGLAVFNGFSQFIAADSLGWDILVETVIVVVSVVQNFVY